MGKYIGDVILRSKKTRKEREIMPDATTSRKARRSIPTTSTEGDLCVVLLNMRGKKTVNVRCTVRGVNKVWYYLQSKGMVDYDESMEEGM